MPNQIRSRELIYFLVWICITCACASSSNEENASSGSLEEEKKETIEDQKTSETKPRDGSGSDEENSGSEGILDNSNGGLESVGPRVTRGILREQVANGGDSSERRKKRHAFFYRAAKPVRWGE